MKVCVGCGVPKPPSEFNKQRGTADGLQSRCRLCFSVYNRQRYQEKREETKARSVAWYESHREEASAYHATRYQANPEPAKARAKARAEAKPDELKAYGAAYYREHADEIKARSSAYAVEHHETIKVRSADYRKRRNDVFLYNSAKARVLSPDQLVERFTRQEMFERDGGICYLCRQPVDAAKATIDHVIPLSRGGLHARSNVKIAHRGCNQSKRKKLLEEMTLPISQSVKS